MVSGGRVESRVERVEFGEMSWSWNHEIHEKVMRALRATIHIASSGYDIASAIAFRNVSPWLVEHV